MTVLFTFDTVSAALEGEQVFKHAHIPCRIIPVPDALSTSCNYSLRLETAEPQVCAALLGAQGVEYAGIFRCGERGGRATYEALTLP
jgi:hypothetical protein